MSHSNESCLCCDQNTKRTGWGSGPWNSEPNRVEFEHAGLPCIIHRGGGGAWCGYVGLAPSHPLHGTHYRELGHIDVHGELTYAEECGGCICHVPKPGEPENLWWLGFDCAHGGDMRPSTSQPELDTFLNVFSAFDSRCAIAGDSGHYWTMDEAKEETKRLAEQLASMAVPA